MITKIRLKDKLSGIHEENVRDKLSDIFDNLMESLLKNHLSDVNITIIVKNKGSSKPEQIQ